jgi:tRNA(Ile)-lysidine synthase
LETYAKNHTLAWIDDESNFDTSLQRNYLRHEVLPKLKQTWPGMRQAIMRSVEHCQHANELLNDLAEMDLKSCSVDAGISASDLVPGFPGFRFASSGLPASDFEADSIPDSASLHPGYAILEIKPLLNLSESRRFNALRCWIQQQQHKLPSQKKLKEIDKSVLKAKADAAPLVTWGCTEIRRYRNRLYIMKPLQSFDNTQIIPWQDTSKPLYIKGLNLTLEPELLSRFDIEKEAVSIRFRQKGQKVKILRRAGTHDLNKKNPKKIFQEQGIPPWERDRVPLICVNNELFIVLDAYISGQP